MIAAREEIAIVGMAGRFPGARNIDEFWRNISGGVESIRPFTREELAASGLDPAVLDESGYVNSGAVLEDAGCFDASFFGCTPREAELMDPQQRVFLEVAWEAFEHAGCDPSGMPGAVGVFAGIAQNTYLLHNLAPHPALARSLAHYQITLGNEKDFLATRTAYKLNLRGPCLSVQTACSSSLVAVHLACQSLLSGECDSALAAGGRIRVPLHAGYHYEDGGIPSPDGRCRPFDASARGAVAGSGMAAVVLKRLSDALADGDTIHAIIKGTAINNDGSAKAGFTAPSVEGQAAAITQALAMAEVEAGSISYVEAHGTGTSLGDPIEIAGLTRAFRESTSARAFCAIGSVKANIGHLDAGAGVTGLIKTALALAHRQLPPSINCASPNPQIDFANSPFFVNTELCDWASDSGPRRAGVSSFGIGGTNAHAILEEAPVLENAPTETPQLLVLSAKTERALAAAAARLANHLREPSAASLADVAWTLQAGRHAFEHRLSLAATTASDSIAQLEREPRPRRALPGAPEIVFMFPGQGAQFAGMGAELHAAEPVFRDGLNRCSAILGFDLHALGEEALSQTANAQPALFAIEWALAQLWQSRGIAPAAMIGHSVGEYVAACLAGVFSLETGLTLIAERARLAQSMPPGAMLAVRLPESELRPLLGDRIDLAAINAPSLCVAAGPFDAVAALEQTLKQRHVAHVRLETSHAFHSAMMDPVIEPLAALVAQAELRAPTIPFISCVTGKWITDAEATDPGYWASHLRQPVRFAAGIAELAADSARVLLEVGPGETLAPLARQQCGAPVFSTLSASHRDEPAAALRALGELWSAGVHVEWTRLHAHPRRRVPLPAYPFERERHWIDAPACTTHPPETIARQDSAASEAEPVGEGAVSRVQLILSRLSGVPVERIAPDATFLELGFDSLFLTQANLAFQKEFQVALTFRQLLEELNTPARLAAHLGSHAARAQPAPAVPAPPSAIRETPGPFRPADISATADLTPRQREHLDSLISSYTARTAGSKALIAAHRPHLADPRAVLGFKRLWKEMSYPIVAERSAGARLWDIDGNEYVDLTMGFGTNLFGHLPDFVREAITTQLGAGIEIGPQTPLAGEVAQLFCELTGSERAGFCNTGSEAVLAALRIARTVTGRSRIALFAGSYHGIFDEVLVRPGPDKPTPVAPGIPASMLENVTVLEYGSHDALDFLRVHAGEFAAVLVEPVQSRNPSLQPREFLHALRGITADAGAALIFDEMITGLRCHPRGAQGWFGVKADIATYGKIPGGGMPIGIVAGDARFLDALDGGAWQYGDDSFPEIGVTFFAGTFVRHPLALAASRAVLRHLLAGGQQLQEELNAPTADLVASLDEHLREREVPIRIARFGSMFYLHIPPELKHAGLLFAHLRARGIHLLEGRACFLSTAHTPADREAIAAAFRDSIDALIEGGFLASASAGETERLDPGAERELPLTESQRGMLAITSLSPDASRAYNETSVLDLRGALDSARLERALQAVVARHAALRTTFSGDGAGQIVHASMPVELKTAGAGWIAEARDHAFDFASPPALRARLVELAPEHHLLVVTFHHLLGNGPSYGVFFDELCVLYGDPDAALERPMQLGDFIAWHNAHDSESAGAFWLRQFSDGVPALDLPLDHPRPPMLGYRGGREALRLDADFTGRIRKTGAQLGGSLFMTLFAAWNALLHRLSGQSDLVVGAAFEGAARHQPGGARLIANTTNLLPLRSRIDDATSFRQMVADTRALVLEAHEHQDWFMGRLVEKLGLRRDPSRAPLVSVTFNFESGKFAREAGGLAIELVNDDPAYLGVRDTATFELYLNIAEKDGELFVRLDYNRDLFDAATIRRWLAHLRTLLRAVVEQPEAPVSAIPLLGEEESALLAEWNDTASAYPREKTIGALFATQAALTPEATALLFDSGRMTYAELNDLADGFAARLAEVAPGSCVGLCAERSPAVIAAMIGILKAGCAYVPLDPKYPRERLEFMLDDTQMAAVFTTEPLASLFHNRSLPVLDLAAPNPKAKVEDRKSAAACVIYTSGSTGTPKGVVVPHRAIARLVRHTNYADLGPEQVFLQAAPLSFDASTFEIWAPLLNGGTLALLPPGEASLADIGAAIARFGVTTLWLTAGLFHVMVEERLDDLKPLRQLLAGGDVLSMPHVARALAALPGCRLINGYGPTENTTFTCCHAIEPRDLEGASIPIGRPISNTQVFILDARMAPAPIGVPGELFIGGDGLALEYLRRPELTAEKFVSVSQPSTLNSQPPLRLYRSGDRARWLADGRIEFLGRLDRQLKIRGFRIEPGEIEAAICAHPAAAQCAVTCADGQRLTAYVAARAGSRLAADDLRALLRSRLPDHMIPAAFVVLDSLPLTANGKVDLQALPAPEAAAAEFAAPEGLLEEKLAAVWSDVLGRERIGRLDNFFDLGGDSLSGLRIVNRIRDLLGDHLPVMAIFEAPTVSELARDLRRNFPGAVANIDGAAVGVSAPQPKLEAATPAAQPIMRIARETRRAQRSTLAG